MVWVGLYDLEELTGWAIGLGLSYVASTIWQLFLFSRKTSGANAVFLRVKSQKV